MSAKRKGEPISLSDSAASLEEERFCRENSNSEAKSEMNADGPDKLSAVEVLTRKMDIVLTKL